LIKHSAFHIDTLLLLAQTTHRGILGVSLYARFCKIPQVFAKKDNIHTLHD